MLAKAVTEVDHVKDLVLHHAEVVKNPDLVRFCDHENR
jgi:hypothetical protein